MIRKIIATLLILQITNVIHAVETDSLIIENLVFEGAGIRGIAYCGALMDLDERGYLSCIDKVGGTSSGSIMACLISIGYTPAECYEIIGSTDFGKFNDGRFGVFGGVSRLRHRMGYYPGKSFLKWLENLIEKKTGNANMTFADLGKCRLTQNACIYKQLVIAVTCLNYQKTIYFSEANFPDMRIADAVHASMAIPLYFEPVIIDKLGHVIPKKEMKPEHYLCVDGGFTANFIIDYFDTRLANGERQPAPTLGLRLDSDAQISEDMVDRNLAYQTIESTGDFMGAFFLHHERNDESLSVDRSRLGTNRLYQRLRHEPEGEKTFIRRKGNADQRRKKSSGCIFFEIRELISWSYGLYPINVYAMIDRDFV